MKKLFTLALAQMFLLAALSAQSDTTRFQLCSVFWKNGQPVNGTTLYFYPTYPGAPIWQAQLPPDQHCAEVTVALDAFPPDTRFAYHAELYDDDFLNGLSVFDLCLLTKHILGVEPFSSPYAMIAGDANRSGSLTTFDLLELRKLLLGIYSELPNNIAWHFIPDYQTFPNPNNPFQTCMGCPEGISLADVAALNGGTAKMIAMKTGDVDGDAALNGAVYALPPATDSFRVILPNATAMGGMTVRVPVRIDKDVELGSFKLEFRIDPLLAQFLSVEGQTLPIMANDFNYDAPSNVLKVTYLSTSGTSVASNSTLFYVDLLISEDLEISDAIQLLVSDANNDHSYAIGKNCGPLFKVGSSYSGTLSQLELPICTGVSLAMPSPNPFSENTWLELVAKEAQTGTLEVFDLHGRLLFSENKSLPSGSYRWEIPAEAMPSSSVGFWRLSMGGNKVSGKLVKR